MQVLVAQRYDGLVALYASYLPSDTQVLCYSVLLNGKMLSAKSALSTFQDLEA